MDQLVLVCGKWSFNSKQWSFLVDQSYGCRIIGVGEELRFDDFLGMVYADFGLSPEIHEVKLSYMSNLVIQTLPQDTPPVFISNERQLHVFVKQCCKEAIRLCVEISTRSPVTGNLRLETKKNGEGNLHCKSENVEATFYRVDPWCSRVELNSGRVHNQFDRGGPSCGGMPENVKHENDFVEDEDAEFRFNYYDDKDGASSGDEDYISVRRKSKEEEKRNFSGKAHEFDLRAEYLDIEMSALELALGQRYASKKDLVTRLKTLTVLQRFDFDVVASSRTLLHVKCWVPRCQWRVRASPIDDSGCFFVRQYRGQHNCSVTERSGRARQATPEVLGQLYMEFVGGIGPSVLPNHVADAMNKRFGLKVQW